MRFLSILIMVSLTATVALAQTDESKKDTHLSPKSERPTAENFRLKDLAGKTHRLTDFKGKVVVVSFWATWCKPCLRELSFLKKLKAKHPNKLEILAVATDGPNTASRIRPVSVQKKLTMPILLDSDGAVMASMNARGILPQSNYIDFGGQLAYAHDGFVAGDEAVLTQVIEALLKEKQP
jgi:thiol-disulfide isomerase/thioredoxin